MTELLEKTFSETISEQTIWDQSPNESYHIMNKMILDFYVCQVKIEVKNTWIFITNHNSIFLKTHKNLFQLHM